VTIFMEIIAAINELFPDESDWRRHEAFAYLWDRLAFRARQRAELALARTAALSRVAE